MLFVALFYTVMIWASERQYGLEDQMPLIIMLWGFGVVYWIYKYREEKKSSDSYKEQTRKEEISNLKYEINKLKRKTTTKKKTVKKKIAKRK